MTMAEIFTLSQAGFSTEQIAQMAEVQQMQQMPQMPQMPQPGGTVDPMTIRAMNGILNPFAPPSFPGR